MNTELDTEKITDPAAERTAMRKKLTDAAMLALSPEAAEELARDFDALRIRLDAVVRSDEAAGDPPEGPIHTQIREVSPPRDAEVLAKMTEEARRAAEGRGRTLLGQAAQFDGVYGVVPRVV